MLRDVVATARDAGDGGRGGLGGAGGQGGAGGAGGEACLDHVSDNGPRFKAAAFARFIESRPELTHIRTRRHRRGTTVRGSGRRAVRSVVEELVPGEGQELDEFGAESHGLEELARLLRTAGGPRAFPDRVADGCHLLV